MDISNSKRYLMKFRTMESKVYHLENKDCGKCVNSN